MQLKILLSQLGAYRYTSYEVLRTHTPMYVQSMHGVRNALYFVLEGRLSFTAEKGRLHAN